MLELVSTVAVSAALLSGSSYTEEITDTVTISSIDTDEVVDATFTLQAGRLFDTSLGTLTGVELKLYIDDQELSGRVSYTNNEGEPGCPIEKPSNHVIGVDNLYVGGYNSVSTIGVNTGTFSYTVPINLGPAWYLDITDSLGYGNPSVAPGTTWNSPLRGFSFSSSPTTGFVGASDIEDFEDVAADPVESIVFQIDFKEMDFDNLGKPCGVWGNQDVSCDFDLTLEIVYTYTP